MRWDDRKRAWLLTRGLGADVRHLYNYLRDHAHLCGIVDVSAETMWRHCEFPRQSNVRAALAILTKTDADQKLGDRPPLFIWDEYLPCGYLVGWCDTLGNSPRNDDQVRGRLSWLASLPECQATIAATVDLAPYTGHYPPSGRRGSSNDQSGQELDDEHAQAPARPVPQVQLQDEPHDEPRDDYHPAAPAPRRRSGPAAPADVNPVTPEYLAALYRHYLPMRPQVEGYELSPKSTIGARMAELCIEQPKPRAWRGFFAQAGKLCTDKGQILVDGVKVSVTMRTLLDKQLGDHVKAAAGIKHKEGET